MAGLFAAGAAGMAVYSGFQTWRSSARLQAFRDALKESRHPDATTGEDGDVVLSTAYELIQRAADESLKAYGQGEDLAWAINDNEIRKQGLLIQYWEDSNTMILAFRGTASVADHANNLRIAQVQPALFHRNNNLDSKVHAGFASSWRTFLQYLKRCPEFLGCLEGRNPTIICCGHSMGGALATLCAAWLASHPSRPSLYTVTFGSPRVGNLAFRDNFHDSEGLDARKTFRVEMERDPVVSVPSLGDWCHVGRQVQFRNNVWRLKQSLDGPQIIPFAGFPNFLTNLPDHLMLTYHHFLDGKNLGVGNLLNEMDVPINLRGRPYKLNLKSEGDDIQEVAT